MGLLDRFRPARGDDSDLGADDLDRHEATDTPEPSPLDVIRPETLWPAAPEWTKVPVMRPSLPAMPVVVSTHFEDSLTAWQPPERFLGDLGHSVSDSAPSGMVEAVAVLAPPTPGPTAPQDEPVERPHSTSTPAGPEQPLTLAMPAPPAERTDSGRWETTRRLPGFPRPRGWPAEEAATDVSLASAPEPEPPVAARQEVPNPQPEPEPVAELVGTAPITAPPEPIVSIPAPAPVSRLVTAPTPPEMPLAQLQATRLPPEAQTRRLTAPTEGEPAATPAPLLGGARGIEPAISTPAPVAPESSDATSPGPAAVEMPLVSPPAPDRPAAGAGGPSSPVQPPPVPPAVEHSHPAEALSAGSVAPEPPATEEPHAAIAPIVGDAEPIAVLPSPGEPSSPVEDPRPAASSDLPLATPPILPRPEAPDGETAPTLGQRPVIEPGSTPLVAEPEPAGSAAAPSPADHPLPPLANPRPSGARRSGLGEPMTSLPSTAAPMSIANMNRAQQVELSRSLIQSQLAARSRSNQAIGQQLHQGAPPAATRPPGPDAELPLAWTPQVTVPIEPLESRSTGVVFDDIPPATPETAPLLSMDPLVGREDAAPGPAPSREAPEGARIRSTIGQRHGVDLTNVPVDRSAVGAAQAHQMGARAYTSDLAVVIPRQAGSLDAGPGEALFAHELTHVAQRMRSGGRTPLESSPQGRMLEAEAAQTELALNLGGVVQPVLDAPAGSAAGPTAFNRPGGPAAQPPSLPLAAAAAPVEPDYDVLATSILQRMTTLTAPGYAQSEVFQAPAFMAGAAAAAPVASAGVQRAPTDAPAPMPLPSLTPSTLTATSPRPSAEDLSNLSKWLYPLIKFRLKNDLREDRERAGLLTDNYRRW